ncbi:diacylglycerol kinase family protein [Brevibacterium sp.]|uniref:diacylglycerol/lipid kinase family protein n=1 Tax=Brevibacterium sp. TaxID=1701 RepID=UPI0028112321|nr:diacylglycerol kinase family protein [Brevibacterium sp.]
MRFGIIVNPRHHRSAWVYTVLSRQLRSRAARSEVATTAGELSPAPAKPEAVKSETVRYRTATTTRAWPGRQQAGELLDWGADVLIVVGGDGTVRAIAPELAGTGVPVLIVPTGTANVLARHLRRHHLGVDMVEVPVNEAEYVDAAGNSRREVFVSMAGIGGDAEAVAGKHRVPGVAGYLWGALSALFSPGVHAVITAAQAAAISSSRCWSIMASKVSHPAGPTAVFPRAEATAEEFEFLAVSLENGAEQKRASARRPTAEHETVVPKALAASQRLRGWAGIALDSLAGAPERNPAMHYWTGTELRITLDEAAPLHLDGDSIGACRELNVRAGADRLLLIVPRF